MFHKTKRWIPVALLCVGSVAWMGCQNRRGQNVESNKYPPGNSFQRAPQRTYPGSGGGQQYVPGGPSQGSGARYSPPMPPNMAQQPNGGTPTSYQQQFGQPGRVTYNPSQQPNVGQSGFGSGSPSPASYQPPKYVPGQYAVPANPIPNTIPSTQIGSPNIQVPTITPPTGITPPSLPPTQPMGNYSTVPGGMSVPPVPEFPTVP